MRRIRRILSIILMTGLLFCSCSTTPANYGTEALTEKQIASKQTKAMQKGHAYIHDGKKLHDLMEMKYVSPGVIDDYEIPETAEILAGVLDDPNAFIITFMVEGYTEQTKIENPNLLDFTGYDLCTPLKVDKIHYLGENVTLNEGDVYMFSHCGAWVLEQDGEMVYSIRQRRYRIFSAFKYDCQYVMLGYYFASSDVLWISNDLGWNEICSDEEAQSFWEQYPKMAAGHVTSADQLFEPGFRE